MPVDLICSHEWYLTHLLAVWLDLPEQLRGRVNPHVSTQNSGIRDVALCAGWADAKAARRLRYRVVVLMEHGVGQSYLGDSDGRRGNPHYVGGAERQQTLDLVLLPNEMAAAVERQYNPGLEQVVIGSPWLDAVGELDLDTPERRAVATVSLHWDAAGVAAEAGSAFREYRSAIRKVGGLVATAHPRESHGHARWWKAHELRFERSPLRALEASPILIADNTSLMYYAAAWGRAVVVLNSRNYRPGVEHGIRFWSHAGIGQQVNYPVNLARAVDEAAGWRHDHQAEIDRLLGEVFPYRGTSRQRAASALEPLCC